MNIYIKVFLLLLIILFIANLYVYYYYDQLLIVNNLYTKNDISKILKEISNLKLEEIKQSKKFILIDYDSIIYKIIYNKNLKKYIKNKLNKEIIFPKYPIEYRIYKNSNGMDWHKDKSLFNEKYLECILTLDNTSNSYFRFIKHSKKYKYYQKPGNLIMLYPLDIEHKIDKIFVGDKKILKFIINYK